MMMSKATDIKNYSFSAQDDLFFDTNIWILLYGPQGNPSDPFTHAYSRALARAIQARSRIWVDVLIISEFINRFARIEYDIQYPNKSQRPNFKQFRNNQIFRPIAQAIVGAVQNILKFSARLESGFSTVDISTLLSEFETTPSDFNDQILLRLCAANRLQLVTHDFDFKGKGLHILTANPRIL